MTEAADAVRTWIIAALASDPAMDGVAGLGVVPGPGSLPQVEIAWPLSSDWGTKTEAGRELRTQITLRVAKGQRERMPGMIAAAERAGRDIKGVIAGWGVASALLIRTQVVDERDGQRTVRVEHRVRVLGI